MKTITVVAIGASALLGWGASKPTRSWASALHSHLAEGTTENIFYNLGIPGDTTTGIRQRFPAEVPIRFVRARASEHRVVIIQVPGQDLAYHTERTQYKTSPELFVENILVLLQQSLELADHTVVQGILPVREVVQPYGVWQKRNENVLFFNELLAVACSTYLEVTLLDTYSAFAGREAELLATDGIHPNDQGHERIYQMMYTALSPFWPNR